MISRTLLLLASAALVSTPAAAAGPNWAALEQLPDEELARQRGGFSWGGLEIDFGADLRTYLGDELVLHTIVNWTDGGAEISRTVSGTLTPAAAAELEAGVIGSGAIRMRVGDADLFLANEGRTAILHRTDGGLQNILINTAPGISAHQEVDATLSVANYPGFRTQAIDAAVAGRLHDMIDSAALAGLGH